MKISKAEIRKITDSRSWQRGVNYYEQGNVLSLFEDEGTIIAKVSGTRDYKVKLWTENGDLDGSCTCPMGDTGVFCKHCVAVGLTYLEGGAGCAPKDLKKQKTKGLEAAITLADIRQYLSQQKTDTLIEMIMDCLTEDDSLRERLVMKAARFGQKELNVDAFRTAITQATQTHGFVDYDRAYDFYRRIENVVDSVEDLLEDGFDKEVIELSEHSLKRVGKALGEMDDSDGYMGDVLERLQMLHHKACLRAKPNPKELAKRLFKWELTTGYDTFYRAAETYADVFGKEGIAVYRRLAEAEWSKLPQLKPGQGSLSYRDNRFRLTSIMEALAKGSGDIEQLVAVKSKDLSCAYHFLEIARIYKDAGNSDKALEWAEKGVKTFPDEPDSRLNEFLANEYHSRNRHAEAMELIWSDFLSLPNLNAYKSLKEHADKCKQWTKWHERALKHVRKRISDAKKQASRNYRYWAIDNDHSTLVEIFLWEKNVEAAWKEAKEGGCKADLWKQLAKLREKDHPVDSIAVYQMLVKPIIEQTNNSAYREAVDLIKKIRGLMANLGQDKEFQKYISSVRTEFKRKRNFITMLTRLKMK